MRDYDVENDSYELRVCSQSAGTVRNQTAPVLGVANDKIRVTTEDVGGAFGMKTPAYPEYPALLRGGQATRAAGAWMSTRSEAFMTDTPGRDAWTDTELALDDKGKFLALAHAPRHATRAPTSRQAGIGINTNNVARCLPGMYHIPKIDFWSRCVFTNTVPMGPYRGAGRPEANYALDRVVEEAARITGIDTAKLRKKNLIPKSAMPYKTADHHDLRQRRFSRRLTPRRWSSPTSTTSTSASARRRSARNCAASASPACWNTPARCRPKARCCRFPATTS